MDHSPGFLKIVRETMPRVTEISPADARQRVSAAGGAVLVDVREDDEWRNGHAVGAIHLGKGVLERDLERLLPDANAEIILYCGGGFRSALACDSAQRMGYKKVLSLAGGYKAMVAAGWPVATGS